MPSTSAPQQHLMGMAYAYKTGQLGHAPSAEVKKVANSMTVKQLHDFAATKGLASGGQATVDAACRIAHRAFGGQMPEIPFFEREEAYGETRHPYGFTVGTGGGRTDKNNVAVGAGSYVIPADVVAGLGDGNSLAGARTFDAILHSMPWGITPPREAGRRGPPAPPHDPALLAGVVGENREPIQPALADGGDAGDGSEVPIQSADGEIIVSPTDVLRVGQHYAPDSERRRGDTRAMMRRGHRVLDAFVREIRGRTIAKMKSLRGPVGSKNPTVGHTQGKAA